MKKIYSLITLLIISWASASLGQSAPAVGPGINFVEGTWFDAANTARDVKKPLFILVYGDNCLNSKKMLSTSLLDPDVVKMYNENFVSHKINASDLKNNLRLTNWGVTSVPTLVFLDQKRNVVYMTSGFKDKEKMINIGEIAMQKARSKKK